jgi:uncharacterized protein YfaS (alpha-2-macroglobulin family)
MRVHMRFWVLGALALLAAACQSKKAGLDSASADAWAKVIVGHTSGLVPRRSEIRVLFANDVTAAAPLGAGTLKIEPAVEGELALRGTRELVLVPTGELKVGQEYQVTLTGKDLGGVPQDIAPYRFDFSVQAPQFDVRLLDLESDPADDRRMIQRGVVTTSDAEASEAIEKMLSATYRGAALQPVWTHSGDGREHQFALSGLERQQQPQDVELQLAGEAIGSKRAEQRTVIVPAVGQFAVFNAQALEEEGRKQILVSFSDALDDGQDLKGLVRLSVGTFTTRIEGNKLLLYPSDDVAGELTVTLEPGIRNRRGERLAAQSVHALSLASEKPQVRFVGNGTILPDAKQMTVAFEAVSARSVQVTATRIFPENIPQYLQTSTLGRASYEIGRVGRNLWRRNIALTGPRTGRWQRYELDVTELMQRYPGSMIQLTLQLTPANSAYFCGEDEQQRTMPAELPTPASQDSDNSRMQTPWQYEEEYLGVAEDEEEGGEDYDARWRDRDNPCKSAYYLFGYNSKVRAQRNLLASNLGLLAKSDAGGRLLVAVTNLATAEPQGGVALELRNFQNQPVGSATSDSRGMATIEPTGTAFLLVAGSGAGRGFLRLGDGNALPVSHFEVGGEKVQKGLKGAIYGERGVWRPGDAMPLTFVVHDRDGTLPQNHPATLELLDPRGKVTQSLVNARPVDGFYRFDARTASDAPTGNWTARVSLGGATFTRRVKVETVMPNRLRIDLDLEQELLGAGAPLRGRLESEWLSGASAAGLRADVKLKLTPTTTQFDSYAGFVFDDPARDFNASEQDVFEGTLGADGSVRFEKPVQAAQAPGMLSAGLTTRVFERGGAFSINYLARDYAPYSRFVGLKVPQVNRRNTLPLDQEHTVDLATVTAQGAAAGGRALSVKLYKVEWRWWWDREEGSLAAFVAREASTRVRDAAITTDAQGRAQWKFRLSEAEWGRYLLRACDTQGGHCTGSVFYVDSPYWTEGRDQTGPAATMLELSADKESYRVGDTATIQLPQSAQGRALVTVENGSGIIDARWVTPTAENARVTIPVTAAMTPNAFVAVTLLQPHAGKRNDRPIRLYGVIPLPVTDAETQLKPVLETPAEWRPESEVTVKVSEAAGKAMTYTLAVVDEGLLSLTNFRTPDLHGEFFRREALGVKTWDLFDDVSGAYGAELERLLALGGSDGGDDNAANKEPSRFVPVAQVLGPFQLPAGRTQEQKVKLPRYVGAVRVMVVAGSSAKPTAYGSAEKSVPVRQPLMILPTMPRVVGPGEEIAVPVSVFAMQDSVRDVRLTIQPDAMFEVVGSAEARVSFQGTGEKIAMLKLRVGNRVGRSTVKFNAASGRERAQDEINIEVRTPNPPSTRVVTQMLQPGAAWQHRIEPHGIPGTNEVTLEVSRLPPLNLARRLGALITYPYGCLEQTTSSVFPQLFLPSLAQLDDNERRRTEANVRAGIERLRGFQLYNGAFSYWPGGQFAADNGYHHWSTTYASHFLVEAEKLGYTVPATMRSGMIRHLRSMARDWRQTNSPALHQAYRLLVLARAGEAEVGAMNRLRELPLDPVERWVLAGAYQQAGLADAARALATGDPMAPRDYRRGDWSWGTALRDHALVLQSLVILNQLDKAEPLVRAISARLSEDVWLSTQESSYALLAMSQLAGARSDGGFAFARTLAGRDANFTSTAAVHREVLASVPDAGAPLALRNTSQGILFATLTVRGTPAAGNEDEVASGLVLSASYSDAAGNAVNVDSLKQGEDVTVDIIVRNNTREDLRYIALTQIVPSGWEIANERLHDAGDGTGERDARSGYDEYRNTRAAQADYVDIRDDRVMQFFDLPAAGTIRFQTRVNAAYQGRFYLPGIAAEAMYDATKYARTAGRWTEVVAR